ncbi:hypothetical protein M3D57_01285 [Corynebacterium sanguinis]|uniref:hypothetical protein n=2 Tax=Corynebacterium sanguinis TaxID=2594913 RepID=UPI0011AA7D83|nr:hypothetical protein [Corynebacterium sanguinis]MCT1583767.1 hypothetical protein [Corynebacterium sanguinis]MCT2046151.1 hypothetical protein [Corynebacterium sanguinis]MCT2157649.1 hypothetical protein [Corynebacterium sanguinis]MDN8576450.1 hypothetical protein [Corynebacterium sanguinis]TVS24377.1 hypothetical protein EKI50_00710 [Corynebacterium sanguinis]
MPLTSTERRLNLAWLLVVALSPVGLCISCLRSAHTPWQFALGVAAAACIAAALLRHVPTYSALAPRDFLSRSFPLLFASYVPSVIGHWQGGLALVALVHPLICYLFIASREHLHEWARRR